MKVLISDKIDDSSLSTFLENNISYDYQPEITPVELATKISDYEALMVRSRTKVTKDIIEKGKKLQIIGRVGSGVDNIDTVEAGKRKIIVVNASDANSQAVAEHTVGLMLAVLRQYPKAFSSMEEGLWLKKELKGSEISGKTVGILGYGNIGKKVEQLVTAFGANVLIHSRHHKTVEFKELFARSDILTIHLALNSETRGCVTKLLLDLMKPSSILINTSRGEIIDEGALFERLVAMKIKGAALDVFSTEPLPVDSKLRSLENLVITPHIGASTGEALVRASFTVVQDLIRFVKGEKLKSQI